ncbi:hypothetical protein EDD22DRAFT_948013 [Suillus occidentalis]|nr:hypothetical protein EDD22DRAFT_948013 [Suillus occidentalis]
MTRTPRPAPSPASPTTPPPVTVATSFKTHLRHIFTRPPQHATPPVVDVPFAQGLQRNAAGGPKDIDDDLIRDEDYNGPPMPDPNEQQQQKVAIVQTDTEEHGGGRLEKDTHDPSTTSSNMSQLQVISSTTPTRTFEDHEDAVRAVAVFPDRLRMITGSVDKTLRIWDLETGVVLKKMEGHSSRVSRLAGITRWSNDSKR